MDISSYYNVILNNIFDRQSFIYCFVISIQFRCKVKCRKVSFCKIFWCFTFGEFNSDPPKLGCGYDNGRDIPKVTDGIKMNFIGFDCSGIIDAEGYKPIYTTVNLN